MGVRLVEISEQFCRWPNQRTWLAWIRRRGLDVNSIPVPTTIQIDDAARTVTVEYLARHPKGGVLLDEKSDRVKLVEVTVPFKAWALAIPPVFE